MHNSFPEDELGGPLRADAARTGLPLPADVTRTRVEHVPTSGADGTVLVVGGVDQKTPRS